MEAEEEEAKEEATKEEGEGGEEAEEEVSLFCPEQETWRPPLPSVIRDRCQFCVFRCEIMN